MTGLDGRDGRPPEGDTRDRPERRDEVNDGGLEARKSAKIDREKVNAHHNLNDYSANRAPTAETCLHTWKDATLREVMSLLGERHPDMNTRHARITIMQIFKSQRDGAFSSKLIGAVSNHRKTPDEDKTLESLRIVVGDYLDVALFTHDDDNPNGNNHARTGPDHQIVERNGPPPARRDSRYGNDDRFTRNGFGGRAGDRFHPYPRPSDGNWKRDQGRNDREGPRPPPPPVRRDSFADRDDRDTRRRDSYTERENIDKGDSRGNREARSGYAGARSERPNASTFGDW
ncbi:hypothetical protein SeLEV6574_g07529 [Synchytrium endobioticum]|uniref:Uncharacterized protein n=1 Tax=Synchytrium endobioticum TaxID=286115 RepID=A0A507CLD0_9FUNG|nr:hypothetical protein SeLEV6574_g07529 [Synchytrium endobioticum]